MGGTQEGQEIDSHLLCIYDEILRRRPLILQNLSNKHVLCDRD
jgi:hypothetical protein